MIFINEWLPNPAGNDATGEWVELFNNGNAPVNLNSWTLRTGGKSKYDLKSAIGVGDYLVLKRTDTKLVLKNADEKLFLYDAKGNLVDQSVFLGSAPEGKSFSRISGATTAAQNFTWAEPTPGTANKISLNTNILHNIYPIGAPLNKNLNATEFVAMALSAAVVLTALVMFVLKRNENVSKLLFGGNEEIR